MALQSGVVQFRGKLGQTVGRRNGNKSITTTVTRNMNVLAVAPAAVSNPKTAKQASQRMKMRAAVNFYRGLRDILNHSWQGTAYRAQSRNEFMQRALNDPSLVIPFLEKGDTRFVPGSYSISSGSLAPVTVTALNGNSFVTSLKASTNQWDTFGQFSADIIANNVGFLDGDKLVFIIVDSRTTSPGETPASQDDYYFTPVSLAIVLNSQSIEPFGSSEPFNVLHFSVGNEKLSFDFGNEFLTPVAAAVVHTRVPDNGASAWQRSNSYFFLAEGLLSMFMDDTQFNKALASYQSTSRNVNSDWFLNIGAFDSDGLSNNSPSEVVVTQVSQVVLPAYQSSPTQTISQMGAISINGVAYIVISEVLSSGETRKYTNLNGTSSLMFNINEIAYLKEKLVNGGYKVIDANTAYNVYGIEVLPEEDRP